MTQTSPTEQPGDRLRGALAPLMQREHRRQLFATWAVMAGAAAAIALVLRLLEENRGWLVGNLWWLLLAGTAAAALGAWLRLRRQPVDPRRAAHLIEGAYPELSALLLTAVAQSPPRPGGRLGYMQEELVSEALRRSEPRWSRVVTSRRVTLTAAAAAAAGSVVLYCGVTALLPDLPSLFDDEYGARISPGHADAERGTQVLVLARFDKKMPPGATLNLRRPGKPPLLIEMRRTLDDPVIGALTPALDGERAEYFVEYGGVRSPRYRLTVFELPEVDRIDARIEYPRQPSLTPKEVTDTRHLTVVLGARITLSVHLHIPAREVALIGSGPPVRLASRSGAGGRVFWGVIAPDRTSRYEVLVRDERGRSNKAPPRLVVEINPNLAPQISLSFPGKDLRVSPLQELVLEAKIHDDVGVLDYGLSYRLAGQAEKEVGLGGASDRRQAVPAVVARASIALEDLKAAPYQLLTYHFWAEDVDAAGKRRRTGSDLHFAEVRPFEERYREAPAGGQAEMGGEPGDSPAGNLARTQKDIMNANWRVERDARGGRPREELRPDLETLTTAQKGARDQAETMRVAARDPASTGALEDAVSAMDEALLRLRAAAGPDPVGSLVTALEAEQRAFAALLRLAQHERMVSRRQGRGGGGSQSSDMPELSNLELKQKDSRYETQREASSARQRAGAGDREALSRLQELARRQKTLTERMREAQAALTPEARQEEEEKRRQLKRLREEQQQLLAELDELAQRQDPSRSEGAERDDRKEAAKDRAAAAARLERSRQEVAESSEALAKGELGRAVGASTRASRELEQAKKSLEKQMANGFEQEMRELREEARQVDEEQRRIGEALAAGGGMPNPTEVRRLASATGKQKDEAQRLLDKVQSLSTEAEPSAPLLSRKLYEGLRKARLADVEKALDVTGQLLERNLADEARQTEEHARQALGELRASVEDAAKGVLGDEGQALRQAKAELDGLLAEAARERTEGAPGSAPGAANPPGERGQQPGDRRDSNQPGGRGQQPGDRPDLAQPDGRGRQPGGQGLALGSDPAGAEPGGQAGASGPGSGHEGPITGEGYRDFSERLRDLEDLLSDGRLRNRAAQVRDRARVMRSSWKGSGKRPTGKLFEQQILSPLTELRDSVAEEIARLEHDDKLVPIDRDPVPNQYSDLVRRYWKRLSEGR